MIPRDPHEPLTAADYESLRERWPCTARLDAAFTLARDVDGCADLLDCIPVDRSRLDTSQLVQMRKRRLVQLVAPLDLLLRVDG